MSDKPLALIIGGGPAGLTAAYELLARSDIVPVVFEATEMVGGISRTVEYKGNRMDMGGHRFFTKSDRVMQWWNKIMPVQTEPALDDIILKREPPLKKSDLSIDPEKDDDVMLVRNRVSRIYYNGKFFDYPLKLNFNTVKKLGMEKILKIGTSYVYSKIFPVKNEKSLEDFFINRFGKELYKTFFKDYTEKVWGVECKNLSRDWGSQRVKGLSLSKAIFYALLSLFIPGKDIEQKRVETSLIERFLYPKFGPGHFWKRVAEEIVKRGGQIYLNNRVVEINLNKDKTFSIIVEEKSSRKKMFTGSFLFSSMPIKELVTCFKPSAIPEVLKAGEDLKYRDFITAGLLLKKLKIKNETRIPTLNNIIPDNWIYIQDGGVKVGRLQIFNNWSPYMVKDLNKIWVGVEYFCNEGDNFWNMEDNEILKLAVGELSKIDMIYPEDVEDGCVIRIKKAYPSYSGNYKEDISIVKDYFSTFENLFMVGRNGMHKYNNMDHSMLTAMAGVDNILNGVKSKENIWSINIEEDYHEEK
ncbi:MAG: NAD(P)/FAD-dependent oxidoreductase [Brevinematia bacterium]